MAGTGYNIPISVSDAQTYSVPQNTSSPTYFVFGSAGADVGGGQTSQEANPYAPATATSSAAEGNAASSTNAPGQATNSIPTTGLSTQTILLIGAGVLVVVGIVVLVILHNKRSK